MELSGTLASDAERERAADRLRTAAGEGRLTTDELSERLGRAYAARTHAELEEVLAGLPALAVPAQRQRARTLRRLQRLALWLVPPNLVCIAIWAVTGAESSFWPKWVLLATGIRFVYGARGLLLGPPPPPPLPPAPPVPGEPRRR